MGAVARKPRVAAVFRATDQQREEVEMMAAYGITNEAIAKVLRISTNTLERHFREELDNAASRAVTKMANALYKNGMEGNVTAQIFYLKTRGRWRETPTLHEITGANGGPLEVIHTLLSDIDAKQREPKVIEHEEKKD
jgi:hypothetical protein